MSTRNARALPVEIASSQLGRLARALARHAPVLRAHFAQALVSFRWPDRAALADLWTQGLCCALVAAWLYAEEDERPLALHEVVPFLPEHILPERLSAALRTPPLADLLPELQQIVSAACATLPQREQLAAALAQDPLIAFYETFAQACHPHLRATCGCYATPAPVVSYIVRSIDMLLRNSAGLADGLLALEQLEILDPAVGSGAFVQGLISHLHRLHRQRRGSATEQGAETWRAFVHEQLLPHLCGYDLLPAPLLVASLATGLFLARTGYDLRREGSRLPLYQGDALQRLSERPLHGRLPLVIGNPPYGLFGRPPSSAWLRRLLQDYKRDLHERKLNLDDDFIKFIRCSQWYIEEAGQGLLAFITSHTYLDGLTHRRMRQALRETFDEIYILDLHGNARQQSLCTADERDENIFPIRQGVAIGIFLRQARAAGRRDRAALVRHAELCGTRRTKYAHLQEADLATTPWQTLEPQAGFYFFVPRSLDHLGEWQALPSLPTIFPLFSTGIKTHLDAVLVGESDESIAHKIARYIATYGEGLPARAPRGSPQHKAALLRQLESLPPEQLYHDYAYRPFDTRRIAYWPAAIEAGDHRFPLMRHALRENVLLVTTRQLSQGSFNHVFVSATLSDMCLLSTATRECAYFFPLYIFEEEGAGRRPNLAPAFVNDLSTCLGLHFVPQGTGDLETSFGPEAVLAYIYALLHAPVYRQRYQELLSLDFPHIPLPATRAQFRALCHTGTRLLALHLQQTPAPRQRDHTNSEGCLIEHVHYSESGGGRVWLNARQSIEGLPPAIWQFRIGHYQICARWLQERQGHRLSPRDYLQYRHITAIIAETLQLMEASDALLQGA
jgi:predicted helicase